LVSAPLASLLGFLVAAAGVSGSGGGFSDAWEATAYGIGAVFLLAAAVALVLAVIRPKPRMK
jgi:hypothetical protein